MVKKKFNGNEKEKRSKYKNQNELYVIDDENKNRDGEE